MIVPMKKVSVITQSKDSVSAVEKLRSLGILHVEYSQTPKGKDIALIEEDIALIDRTVNILNESASGGGAEKKECQEIKDWKIASHHIVDLWSRLDQIEEYARGLKKKINDWEPWGDFDPLSIKELAEKGIYVTLYQVPAKEMKKFPAGVIVKPISAVRGLVNCAVISREKAEVPFSEITIPQMGLGEMRSKVSESGKIAAFIKEVIEKHVCHKESLLGIKRSLEKELEFNKALKGMGGESTLAYVTGYIPYDEAQRITEAAQKEKWGILVADPSPEDAVPTLLRNPRWVSIIAPVFKLMESTPGYGELDISFWFLLFFSIFFGMLIGDAGIGLVFVALTAFAQVKLGKKIKDKSIFALFYILSSFAILWGVLTATFFGQAWLSGHIKPLVPSLRDDKTIQAFCFFLGAAHLTIAHSWRVILKSPAVTALADIGWILIIWGGFFLAKMLILGEALPAFAKWLFILGSICVVLFTSPDKNVLKGIGNGFGALLLNIVNSFTDVVSYIRLFAVGLAGVAIADAFNNMAADVGRGNIFTAIAAIFIVLLGQTLNVILGPIAVLVHGVRLNVLEFCNHLDIKWTGFPYKPLKD